MTPEANVEETTGETAGWTDAGGSAGPGSLGVALERTWMSRSAMQSDIAFGLTSPGPMRWASCPCWPNSVLAESSATGSTFSSGRGGLAPGRGSDYLIATPIGMPP